MKKTIHFISILFLLLWSSSLLAQLYPVQLVPQLIPPHTNKLIDYTDVSINRIQMQVVTTDITVVNRPVFLKIYIEGNGLKAQSSALTNGIAPIYINGGDILSLGSVDLAPYFRLRNLEGISQNTYAQTLPDGMYNICFEMYDLVTQKRLSQRSCAMMYLMLNDPPYLNMPSDKEQLSQTDFTNIPFSWTPRQLNASNVSYTFELKELRDPNLEAGYAFDLAPILYSQDNIRSTTLLYDLSMPPLFTGKRYAWRVKATSHNGLAENSVFKNNGYSEVRSFRIAVNCDAPTMLLAQPQGTNAVKISWIGEANHLKYHIQYRKASVPNAVWFDRYETQNQTVLTNLESGVDYEFRVGGSCEPEMYLQERAYTYSRSQQFSVASREDDSNFSCGLKPNIELLNSEPITNLVVNESFYAGDFEVKILALEGDSGVYSGYGSIYVPYLKVTLAVEFKQIQINTAYQLFNGMVETVYDPDWKNVHNVNELNQEEDIDIVVDFEIEKIIVDSEGNPVIIGTNGEEQSLDKNKNYTITDKEGNIWKVGSDISAGDSIDNPKGSVAHSGKATPENTNGINKKGEVERFTAEGISFVFSNTKDSKYTLDDALFVDQLSQNKITTAYKKVSGVYLPYKAVVRGMEDVIFAKLVSNSGLKIAKDSIDFKTASGEGIAFTEVDGGYELKLVGGGFDYKIEEVMVVVMQNGKWQVAGAFELVNVKAMELPVHIVPTSTTSLTSLNKGVLDDLKKYYSAIGITLKEQITAVYDDTAIDLGEISKDDKSILSKYTKSEQDFINRYVRQNGTEASFYLFVVDAGGAGRELKGRMPLNSQFGFIFEPTAKTIAHELGHGVFGLQHPFTQYNVNQGAVKSIMDYGSQVTEFNQMDWKQIHRPNFSFKSIVQKKGDGAEINKEFILLEDGYFITPSNKLIKLSKGTKINFYQNRPQLRINGALFGFITAEGRDYISDMIPNWGIISGQSYNGYYEVVAGKTKNRYIDANIYAAGEHLVHYIHAEKIDDAYVDKVKYSIYKQKTNINIAQLSKTKDFTNSNFSELKYKRDPSTLIEEIISTFEKEVPKTDEKGTLVDSIKVAARYTVFIYKDGNDKYNSKFQLTGAPQKGNTLLKGKQVEIEELVSSLIDEKLNELGGLEGAAKGFRETQNDESGVDLGEFYVADMNGHQWAQTLGELGSSVWETANLPEGYWNKDTGFEESTIHMPPVFSGVSNGVVEELTSYPQLIKLGYEVATKAEVRNGLWESVKNISVESIKTASIEFYEKKKDNYTSDKPYIVQHTVSKDAVQVASIIAGTGFLKKGGDLTDGVKETGKRIAKEAREKASKEFLQTFDEAFIQKLKKIPNYDKLEAALLESWKKHHGSKFSLQYIYDNKLVDKIKAFELKIHGEGNFTADMVLKGGLGKGDKFIEFKSWKTGSFSLLNTPQYKNQLKAYMKSGDFEQIFDAKKLLADGVANPDIFVKQKIVDLIKKNAEEFKIIITEAEIKALTVESSLIKKFNAK